MIEPANFTGVAAGATHGRLAQANPSIREATVFRVLFDIRDAHPSRRSHSAGTL
jgi:hypothetical protein